MSILILLAAALAGAIAGFFAATHLILGRPAHKGAIAAFAVFAALAAAATNATQRLLDAQLAFETVDLLERASYFVFGFAATSAWVLLRPSRLRWLLMLLVPVALYEPLRIGVALLALALRRLGVW